MCTSWLIQSAAASFEDGASARLATSPNSTRSNGELTRRVASSRGHRGVDAQPAPQRVEHDRCRRTGATEEAQIRPGAWPSAPSAGSSSRVSDTTSRSIASRST